MAVWHGNSGGIRLVRSGQDGRVYTELTPGDVDVGRRRFSFFGELSTLVSGDRVWFRRVTEDGGLAAGLPFDVVAGNTAPDWQGFVSVDAAGGIRLYTSWSDAAAGNPALAVPLATPSASYRVSVDITNEDERALALITSYTIRTTRQNQETTSIGEGFREQTSTLIGGNGALSCLWDITNLRCDREELALAERAYMLHQLALRQQTGAAFRGIFLLKNSGAVPLDVNVSDAFADRELFYEANCVIDSVESVIDVDDIIRSTIQFSCTGPITLKYEVPLFALLLEQPPLGSRLLTESGEPIYLEFLED